MMVIILVGTQDGMDVVNGYVDKRNLTKKFKPLGGHLVGLAFGSVSQTLLVQQVWSSPCVQPQPQVVREENGNKDGSHSPNFLLTRWIILGASMLLLSTSPTSILAMMSRCSSRKLG